MSSSSPLRQLAAPALVLGLALTGCGGSDNKSATPAPGRATYSDPAASQGAGAASDLTKHTCTASAAGVWSFSGTLKNSTKQDSTYTMTLSLVQKVGSTVVATHQVVQKVDAGATQAVDAKNFSTQKGSKQLACVVSTRAKRG